MRAFLPLALLAVTACYSPRTVEPSPGAYDQGWGPAPLEASLFYNEFTGFAAFEVSRPASVAIFALRPGGGMEMIYPARGMGTRTMFAGGDHVVRTGARPWIGSRSMFHGGSHVVRTSGSPYRLMGNWSMAQGHGPMYILLVASEEPLDIDRFRLTNPLSWLTRTAVTYNPHMALEALVGEIVPQPNTSAWTTAMQVVWPMEPWQSPRYVRVRCANGVEILAPRDAILAGYPVCPEQLLERPDSARQDTTVVVPKRSKPDSTSDEITAVLPTRPQPPEGWMATRIDGVDLRSELRRLREVNGKSDPGVLEVRPFPAFPSGMGDRERGIAGPHRRGGSDVGARTRSVDRPDVTRSRPAARPASRPASRPAPAARPDPPRRDPPKARPTRPVKPTKPGGGGG